MKALTTTEITRALTALPGWSRERNALAITLRFPSFATAITWMASLSEDIDTLAHHPEWTNVYDQVRIRLTTHDAGDQITDKDVALAKILHWRFTQEYA